MAGEVAVAQAEEEPVVHATTSEFETDRPRPRLVPPRTAPARVPFSRDALLEAIDLVNVPGQADLMFCREMDSVRQEDLERLLRPCRLAYDDVAGVPTSSPPSRFDIQDWTPLDP